MRPIRAAVVALVLATLLVGPVPSATASQSVPLPSPGSSAAIEAPRRPVLQSAVIKVNIPPDCRNKNGFTICYSKKQKMVIPLWNGLIVREALKFDRTARPGGKASDGTGPWNTRNGTHRVYAKYYSKISTAYNVPLPFFMKFSGGQGFHYSSEFDKTGYPYSHGCVGLKSYAFAKWLYSKTKIGTRVIITRG